MPHVIHIIFLCPWNWMEMEGKSLMTKQRNITYCALLSHILESLKENENVYVFFFCRKQTTKQTNGLQSSLRFRKYSKNNNLTKYFFIVNRWVNVHIWWKKDVASGYESCHCIFIFYCGTREGKRQICNFMSIAILHIWYFCFREFYVYHL